MTDFAYIKPGARVPWNAVIVTVRSSLGRTVADVAAVEHIADFPMPVPQALVAADRLREQMGLNLIAVRLEDDKLWKPQWGTLLDAEKLD